MWYYYNNIDTNNNTQNNSSLSNNTHNNISNNENKEPSINNIGNITDTDNSIIYPMQFDTFYIFDVPSALTEEFGHYYDDTGIILYQDNTFKINLEEGFSLEGKFNITDNTIICMAYNIQGENDYSDKINAEFTFKAINHSDIQLVNMQGSFDMESHVMEIGNKYILP